MLSGYRELCRALRQRRTDLGLRQREVAERMDGSQAVVSQLENGTYPNPGVDLLNRWAAALDIEIVISLGEPGYYTRSQRLSGADNATIGQTSESAEM